MNGVYRVAHKEPQTTKNIEKKSHLTGGSVMEGVQESTFYSVNQSQEDQEKRVISPLTQVESIYARVDPLKIHVKNERDRNASNFGKKTVRVKQ